MVAQPLGRVRKPQPKGCTTKSLFLCAPRRFRALTAPMPRRAPRPSDGAVRSAQCVPGFCRRGGTRLCPEVSDGFRKASPECPRILASGFWILASPFAAMPRCATEAARRHSMAGRERMQSPIPPGRMMSRRNYAFPRSPACLWILRMASAICSMSVRGPSNMVCPNQRASWHSRSLTGQWLFDSQALM
jgi:hypothetical protein